MKNPERGQNLSREQVTGQDEILRLCPVRGVSGLKTPVTSLTSSMSQALVPCVLGIPIRRTPPLPTCSLGRGPLDFRGRASRVGVASVLLLEVKCFSARGQHANLPRASFRKQSRAHQAGDVASRVPQKLRCARARYAHHPPAAGVGGRSPSPFILEEGGATADGPREPPA